MGIREPVPIVDAGMKAGIDIRSGTGVKSFIADASGAVTGVVVEKDGQPWRIGGQRGGLVNAGGFSHNQEMRNKYQPGTSSKWTAATGGNTGEMIQEMMKIGAAIGQMEEMVGNQMAIAPGKENKDDGVALMELVSSQMSFTKPHSIVVDRSGVR